MSVLSRQDIRGFTIVELMISMVLSMLIVAALVMLSSRMGRASAELERSSRQIENGRYAVDVLAEEIRMAGFYGDVRLNATVVSDPDPCDPDIDNQGWDAAPLTVPRPLVGMRGTVDVPACVANHQANTGILVSRRVAGRTVPAASAIDGNGYLQTSFCSLDPFAPPLIFSQNAADLTLRTRDCGAVNTVRQYFNRMFFVATCSECGTDDIPTLKRLDVVNEALVETAIAEGIEEVQYEYGFDTNNDGTADVYRIELDGVAGSPSNTWDNVVTVRIWLIARSTEATDAYTDTKTYQLGLHGARGPFNDAFKRRVFSTLVRLNNIADLRL